MLCCLETPWSNHHDAYNRQTGDGISSFPGNRRFVKTGGNALAAAPPQQNNNFQHQASGNGGDLVSVTVPPGVTAGQAIHVNAPDGSGRTVMATVPQGMGPGSSFMVEFPPSTPAPSVVSSSVMSSTHAATPQQIDPVDYSQVTAMPPPIEEPFAQAVPIGAPPGATTISPTAGHHAPPPPAPFGQPMLRVQVPPGTAPGTTLYVQVPGENRTIPAQVPPGGVSSFHVPYDAQAPAPPQTPQPAAPPGEKLLLVQVPPDTAPGASLHVSIPDEPGRVIAATVPPGNVSQFHVSYRPGVVQSAAPPTIMPPPRNSNNGYNRYNNNRNNNNRNSGGGGLGGMLLPALGGAALGAAAVSMYDHYHNNNGYNDGNAYGGDGDYGGDYGGGDYGGADDYGGGDFGGFGDFGGDF